jgi:hypothetical protein
MADQVAGWYWPSEIGWFNLVGQAVQWQERLMDLKLYTSCTIYDNKEEQKLRFDVWTMFASGWRILRRGLAKDWAWAAIDNFRDRYQ